MALEFQNLTNVSCSSCTSRTGTIPSGFSPGDLLIAMASIGHDGGFLLNNPSGWTGIRSGFCYDAYRLRSTMSYRIAQAGDTSWTWNSGGYDTSTFSVVILRYTGQDVITPIHASANTAYDNSNTAVAPSVGYTSVNSGSMALQTAAAVQAGLYTPPSQLDIRYSTNAWTAYAGGDKHVSGTGSTGTASWTTGNNQSTIGITVVINAAKTFIPTINIF